MTMVQPLCLFGSVSENPFTFVRKRQIDRCRNLFTNCGPTFDFLTDAFDRGVIPQEPIRQVFVFTNQSQKQVFRFDRRTSELAGLVASEEDHSPCSFSVSFEHIFDSLKYPNWCDGDSDPLPGPSFSVDTHS